MNKEQRQAAIDYVVLCAVNQGTDYRSKVEAREDTTAAQDGSPDSPSEKSPREKLMVFGPGILADAEVVALLIGGSHSLERARLVLDAVGGVGGLAKALPQELMEIPGIGEATATALTAAAELRRRIDRQRLPFASQLRSPRDAESFLRSTFTDAKKEQFVVLGLDARQRIRLVRTVAVGSLSRVEVYPREVFRPLIRAGMHSCVIAHNHPSGDPKPSETDIALNGRLVRAGTIVGICILDHLIMGDGRFSSMAELGLMPSGD